MSRALYRFVLIAALAAPQLARAQDGLEAQTGSPPERIDLLADAKDAVANPPGENCSPDQDGIETEGPIIVCRAIGEARPTGISREEAQRRYAERTMDAGAPRAPDLFGIPNHGMVTFRGCFIPPCPPPPAYMIDFASLPEAPAGSDADRIARGLPPLGKDSPPVRTQDLRDLALPPSPSGSASPAAAPSG